jgi:hypothetical protein
MVGAMPVGMVILVTDLTSLKNPKYVVEGTMPYSSNTQSALCNDTSDIFIEDLTLP